jgi:uncharacterized protein (DUF1501 family)
VTINRREFICRCTQFALSGAALGSTWGSLAQIAEAALPAPTDDYGTTYRALVCVFLAGGNDAFNMVVPASGQAYTDYADSRQNLALPSSSLLGMNGTAFGFNENCPELQTLFNSSRLAVLANTGMLVRPTTRNDWENNLVPLPPHLFSHNSQTEHWHNMSPQTSTLDGWGGRMTEDIDALGGVAGAAVGPLSQISLRGINAFQRGTTSLPYTVSPNGVTSFTGLNTSNTRNTRRLQAFNELLDQKLSPAAGHLMEQGYADVMRSTMNNATAIDAALTAQGPLSTVFPSTSIGDQLSMVANLIGVRSTIGLNRQVFFVRMGGYDTHGSQVTRHTRLMTELSAGLSAFDAGMGELGLRDNVTTFTASEFGRTLTSNGDGTDHGWGGHHLVMGGSVDGMKIFGTMPSFVIGGPDDTRSGRLIPTTSAEQYAATLALWFGVQDGALNAIFPNLPNFATRDLGFML